MKKTVIFLLIISFALPLCSCTTISSPVYASYGKYEITRNMYEYWTAYYKSAFYATFAEYGFVDGEYDETVWDQSVDGHATLGEQVTEHVDSLINEMLVCAQLFDQLGLSNDKTVKDQINELVEELLKNDMDSAGSRQELNSILGVYGMNINTLRRVFEYEAMASVVSDRLFGEGGEHAVTDEERERYYQENYHRAKHILITNDEKYVLDDNGDPKMDIYTGRYVTEELTEEEKAEKQKLAEDIYNRCISGEDFDMLYEEYNEDGGKSVYTDGYFITADSLFDTKYLTAVLTSDVGEVKLADTSYGLMIIKKYPLEAGLWENEINAVFFSDMDANIIAQKKTEVYGKNYTDITYDNEYKTAFRLSDIPALDSRLISYTEQ